MTLSVSHGAFDGLCSEFRDWRCAIARAAGYGIVDDGSEPAHILLDFAQKMVTSECAIHLALPPRQVPDGQTDQGPIVRHRTELCPRYRPVTCGGKRGRS